MDQAECYGFYVYFAVFAAALAAFAWQQKPVPVDKRSMHVDMPAAAGSRLSPTPPDPRNDSGVLKPFDEAEAQAYAEALAQEAGAGEPPQAGA